jgi:ASC-1-like (ASCH) protein
MKLPRVFVPLAKEPYNWFASGRKKWELRRCIRQYSDKNIQTGKVVELRCGYSDPSKAIWGVIEETRIYGSLNNVFEDINYDEIIPIASNLGQAIDLTNEILNLESYHNTRLIAFKVRKIENPEFIQMSSEYYKLILSGQKKSTIRKGRRYYRTGEGIIFFESKAIVVNIISTKFVRLSQISIEEIKNDGFNSMQEIEKALSGFYGEIDKEEIMTIVNFEVEEVEGGEYVSNHNI